MSKIKQIVLLCGYQFRIEMRSKRVWLGYLTGMMMVLNHAFGYLKYTKEAGTAIHILEPFIIAGNSGAAVMFIVLGWLLIISDAPFFNNNAMYLLYRTERKTWNTAKELYLVLQGICYYGFLAFSSVFFSCSNGYSENVWSQTFVALTKNLDMLASYRTFFPYAGFIHTVSVWKGFWCTWSLCLLYGLTLAMFLYVFNLFSNHIVGITAAFLFHFLGYEMMQEGFGVVIKYSMLARSIAVRQIGMDSGVKFPETIGIFLLILLALFSLSGKVVAFTDYRETVVNEGE